MKSDIERRHHRRAVNTFGRLVFTALGPLTLSLLFAAYADRSRNWAFRS